MSDKFDHFFNEDKQHPLTETQLAQIMPELSALEESLSKLKVVKKEVSFYNSQCDFMSKVFWKKLEDIFPEPEKEIIDDCCTQWSHDNQCLEQDKSHGNNPGDLIKRIFGGPGGPM